MPGNILSPLRKRISLEKALMTSPSDLERSCRGTNIGDDTSVDDPYEIDRGFAELADAKRESSILDGGRKGIECLSIGARDRLKDRFEG